MDDPVRVKGFGPHLVIHRKGVNGVERLASPARAHDGDLVQISYVAAGNRQGVIISIDDRGETTLHHPTHLDGSSSLIARGEQPLGHAYQLDDAAGFERFVFVTAGDQPVDARVVMEAAAQAHRDARGEPLRLPSTWRQSSVVLTKHPVPLATP